MPPSIAEEERIDNQLKKVGYEPEDIDFVVNTHLHYDHCGNNSMFKDSTILVNEAEYVHAVSPGWWEASNYLRKVFEDPELNYHLIKGRYEPIPGVRIVPTPGHTSGHQSVAVDLHDSKVVVLAGDAIYLRENLEAPVLPGVYINAQRYSDSADELVRITQSKNGTLLLAHSKEYLSPKGWSVLGNGIQTFT